MRPNDFARMSVVKKEEKEGKLREFIAKDIATRRATGAEGEKACYRMLALSLESPVARAMAALAADVHAAGIVIEAIFVRHAPDTGLTDSAGSLMHHIADCRLTQDVRLLDAHEQLVLGTATAWIGDCMRRDPSQRDAYECYAEDGAGTAEWAARSFERIWAGAEPMSLPATDLAAPVEGEAAIEPQLMALTANPQVLAATRH